MKHSVTSGHLVAVIHIHIGLSIHVKVRVATVSSIYSAGGEEEGVETAYWSDEDSSCRIVGRSLVTLDEVELDDLGIVDVDVVAVAQAGVEGNVK